MGGAEGGGVCSMIMKGSGLYLRDSLPALGVATLCRPSRCFPKSASLEVAKSRSPTPTSYCTDSAAGSSRRNRVTSARTPPPKRPSLKPPVGARADRRLAPSRDSRSIALPGQGALRSHSRWPPLLGFIAGSPSHRPADGPGVVYACAAVSLLNGAMASLTLPWDDASVMSLFLNLTVAQFPRGHCIVLMDRAG